MGSAPAMPACRLGPMFHVKRVATSAARCVRDGRDSPPTGLMKSPPAGSVQLVGWVVSSKLRRRRSAGGLVSHARSVKLDVSNKHGGPSSYRPLLRRERMAGRVRTKRDGQEPSRRSPDRRQLQRDAKRVVECKFGETARRARRFSLTDLSRLRVDVRDDRVGRNG